MPRFWANAGGSTAMANVAIVSGITDLIVLTCDLLPLYTLRRSVAPD
jgi:hypothetical protein